MRANNATKIGNHEANCDNGGTGSYTESICVQGQSNFTGFRNHFRMPSEQSGGVENFWYSWDYGMVHFVQFNTETDVSLDLAPSSVYIHSETLLLIPLVP